MTQVAKEIKRLIQHYENEAQFFANKAEQYKKEAAMLQTKLSAGGRSVAPARDIKPRPAMALAASDYLKSMRAK